MEQRTRKAAWYAYGFCWAALTTVLLALPGCVLAPVLDSVSKVGFTQGDRAALLDDRLREMSQALYWGRSDAALAFVAPASRIEISRQLRLRAKDEKVVESKVQSVEFSENTDSAAVIMSVKAYRAPFYVVNERLEHQKWEFAISTGWQMVSLKEEMTKG